VQYNYWELRGKRNVDSQSFLHGVRRDVTDELIAINSSVRLYYVVRATANSRKMNQSVSEPEEIRLDQGVNYSFHWKRRLWNCVPDMFLNFHKSVKKYFSKNTFLHANTQRCKCYTTVIHSLASWMAHT
jgi:hypothetical protein